MVRISSALLVIAALSACPAPEATPLKADKGTASGMPTTATLGAAGGTLSAGALTITVPAGVLAADTTFTATPITATAPGARGQAMRLGPEGQTFSAPVKVTFRYADADLAGASAEALLVAYQHSSGIWAVPGEVTLDTTARTVTVETTHFSDWSMVAGAQLSPSEASVKVRDSLTLAAVSCFKTYTDAPDPLLVGLRLGFPCNASPTDNPDLVGLSPLVKDWAVNGQLGGSAATGTVSGDAASATFTAPEKRPADPGIVAVSAKLQSGSKSILLVSNVAITDGPRIRVQGRYAKQDQALGATARGDVTDEGFEFVMAWQQSEGEVPVTDRQGGAATNVRDSRAGCVTPTLAGPWDELRAEKVTIIGSFFQVEGQTTRPAITTGVSEGDCATMTAVTPGVQQAAGLNIGFPTSFFTMVDPPPVGTPLVVAAPDAPGWTLTYTTLQ